LIFIVYYKYVYTRYLWLDEQEKSAKSESFYEAQEVRGLPEVNDEQRKCRVLQCSTALPWNIHKTFSAPQA
jgi:hypothetical protein